MIIDDFTTERENEIAAILGLESTGSLIRRNLDMDLFDDLPLAL